MGFRIVGLLGCWGLTAFRLLGSMFRKGNQECTACFRRRVKRGGVVPPYSKTPNLEPLKQLPYLLPGSPSSAAKMGLTLGLRVWVE